MSETKTEPKSPKVAPFRLIQAAAILALLVITGALLIRHTRTQASSSDPWISILDQYKCQHHNDIPVNVGDGSTGGCVQFAQFLLELGSGQFHALGTSYDASTKAQVVDFQQKAELPTNGRIDEVTWAKLEDCVNLAANPSGFWTCKPVKTY